MYRLFVYLFISKLISNNPFRLKQFIITKHGQDGMKTVYRLQKFQKQKEKAKLDLDFLNICRAYGVIPKFLRFKLYSNRHLNSNLVKSCLHGLLLKEIKFKNKVYDNWVIKVKDTNFLLNSRFNCLELFCIKRFINTYIDNYINKCKNIHHNKLKKLNLLISNTHTHSNEFIFNFSSYNLSKDETRLLALGLEFKLPKYRINYTDYFFSFEKILLMINNLKTYKTNFESVKQDVKSLANHYFYKFKSHKVFSYLINKTDIRILKNLKLNKQIIICRPDKGNGVVLLDKLDYINKMNIILENETEFNKIDSDIFKLSLKLEDSLNRILRKLLKDNKIDKTFYNSTFSSGSSPGILYGLPKIHKTNTPLRPILSAVNSHNFKLAKCLIPWVTPFTSNSHTINNSYNFKEWLLKIENVHQHFMSSFDITSLYTNIPTSEAINILLNRIFAEQDVYHGLNKKEFGQLLNAAAKDTYFIFNNKLFYQKNSLAMGNQIFHKLKRNLLFILKKNYPQIDFRLVFHNNFSIKNFCNHKESTPKALRSGIVYEFICRNCLVSYIGSTSRQLHARFSEHKGLSFRTNLPLNNPPYSNIYNHCHSKNHELDFDCFKIIHNNNQPDSLRILESLAIKQSKPQLNADSGPYQLLTV